MLVLSAISTYFFFPIAKCGKVRVPPFFLGSALLRRLRPQQQQQQQQQQHLPDLPPVRAPPAGGGGGGGGPRGGVPHRGRMGRNQVELHTQEDFGAKGGNSLGIPKYSGFTSISQIFGTYFNSPNI